MYKKSAAAVCGSYDKDELRKAMTESIQAVGGLDWVKPGMRIGIKLNLCAAKKPETAAITHPEAAAVLTEMLIERGASVVLGDSPGGPYNAAYISHLYESTGVKLCLEAGGELNEDYGSIDAKFPEGVSIKEFKYVSWLDKCDAVINFCKLKSHGLMGITAAVKNLYGTVPGTVKSEYHYLHTDPLDFANMLVDLNEYTKARLCICDAVEIMEGNGPTMGTPRHLGLILASTSPYELDRMGAALLSVDEKEIPFLTAAKQRGLLSEDPEEDPDFPESFRVRDFVRSGATACWFIRSPEDKGLRKLIKQCLYVLFRSKPESENSCIACGKCVENCPAKAIVIKDGKASINRSLCVRCFCCQEFCPVGAMKVKRSLAARLLLK